MVQSAKPTRLLEIMDEPTKNLIDFASLATMLGAMGAMLPPLAALFTIIWTGIRIYESRTVQQLLDRKKPEQDPED